MYFSQRATFKDVVFTQKSDGEWSAKLLSQLDLTTIALLREEHTSPKSLSSLTDGQVLTLAGIFVLQTYFTKERKLWKLVVEKARRKLISQGIKAEQIDSLANSF